MKLNILKTAAGLLLINVCLLDAQPKTTIAVYKLRSSGLTRHEANQLTDHLRSSLVQLNRYSVVDRYNMDNILEEQSFQQTGCTTFECAIEIGKLLGVQKMLTGSVGRFGRLYTIELMIIDMQTGSIEKSTSYNYDGEKERLLTVGIKSALSDLIDIDLILKHDVERKLRSPTGNIKTTRENDYEIKTIISDNNWGFMFGLSTLGFTSKSLKTYNSSFLKYHLGMELPTFFQIAGAEIRLGVEIATLNFNNRMPIGGEYSGLSILGMLIFPFSKYQLKFGMGLITQELDEIVRSRGNSGICFLIETNYGFFINDFLDIRLGIRAAEALQAIDSRGNYLGTIGWMSGIVMIGFSL